MRLNFILNKLNFYKKTYSIQNELMQVLSYIRNIVIIGRGENTSAEILMEELSEITDHLKPAFQNMEHYLHVCDITKAENVLFDYVGTGFSKDLGRFLSEWDSIPSAELLGTIDIYLENIKELNNERKTKHDEIVSDLIYFPVVINAMLVLLDFVYIAFFIEQQNLLSHMYY